MSIAKSEQKMRNKKYTFSICVRRVWIIIRYFFFEKQTFNGLLVYNSILYVNNDNKCLSNNLTIILYSIVLLVCDWRKFPTHTHFLQSRNSTQQKKYDS